MSNITDDYQNSVYQDFDRATLACRHGGRMQGNDEVFRVALENIAAGLNTFSSKYVLGEILDRLARIEATLAKK